MHVNYNGMNHWVAANGLSVRHLKKSNRSASFPAVASGRKEMPGAFMQFIPVSTPAASEPLRGVHISFADGVSLTLQECTPETLTMKSYFMVQTFFD